MPRPDRSCNWRMHLVFSCPCFLFTVLFSYGWARQYLDAFLCACVRMCAYFKNSSPWRKLNNWLHFANQWKAFTEMSENCVLEKMLGFSHEETHNIRRCRRMCHWCWRMWHIEGTQAFPQTRIWGEPTFVRPCCLWGNKNYYYLVNNEI